MEEVTLKHLGRPQRHRPIAQPRRSGHAGSIGAHLERVATQRSGTCLWIATPDVDAARRAYPQAINMGYLPSGTLLSHFPDWRHAPSVHLLAVPTTERVTQVISRLQEHGCLRSRVDRTACVAGLRGFITTR